uniref:Uncharacterized protein n=1 Tax=Romanomermis culicivorax TaxID=13658 RepID=A0A915JYS2_ROMCU
MERPGGHPQSVQFSTTAAWHGVPGTMQPPPMVPMDIQQPQQPSTSTAQLGKHSQPIPKSARYEYLIK